MYKLDKRIIGAKALFIMQIILLVMLMMNGCGGTASQQVSTETGDVVAKLVWGDSKTTGKTVALIPTGVITVRVIISATGMTTKQQDYPVLAGTGSISGVPVGTGRTVTFQGLDGTGTVSYQGVASNVTVLAGQTTDIGTITMLLLNQPTAAAPSGLSTTATSSSQINLTWIDNSNNETGFKIERKTGAGGTYTQIATAAANAYSYSNTGLTASTAYYYRIRATNGAGESAYSNEANATTLDGGAVGLIQLPKTGQTVTYAAGDDGATQRGVAWPVPRFTDNNNGTVTDNLTGLVWLKNANCFGKQIWTAALTSANSLVSGACGLSDGSTAGQWRLPNRKELQSLVDRSRYNVALPTGHPFTDIPKFIADYWSSSSFAGSTDYAWDVDIYSGAVSYHKKNSSYYVWPVRTGQ